MTQGNPTPIYIDSETGIVLTGTLHDDDFDNRSELRATILKWRGLIVELESDGGRQWMQKAYSDHEQRSILHAVDKLKNAAGRLAESLRLYEEFWIFIEDANDLRRARERERKERGE